MDLYAFGKLATAEGIELLISSSEPVQIKFNFKSIEPAKLRIVSIYFRSYKRINHVIR